MQGREVKLEEVPFPKTWLEGLPSIVPDYQKSIEPKLARFGEFYLSENALKCAISKANKAGKCTFFCFGNIDDDIIEKLHNTLDIFNRAVIAKKYIKAHPKNALSRELFAIFSSKENFLSKLSDAERRNILTNENLFRPLLLIDEGRMFFDLISQSEEDALFVLADKSLCEALNEKGCLLATQRFICSCTAFSLMHACHGLGMLDKNQINAQMELSIQLKIANKPNLPANPVKLFDYLEHLGSFYTVVNLPHQAAKYLNNSSYIFTQHQAFMAIVKDKSVPCFEVNTDEFKSSSEAMLLFVIHEKNQQGLHTLLVKKTEGGYIRYDPSEDDIARVKTPLEGLTSFTGIAILLSKNKITLNNVHQDELQQAPAFRRLSH